MSTRAGNILRGVALPVRLVLGAVFIAAAWYKIGDPHAFGLSIASYQIVPDNLVNIMAASLPWLEIIVGLALMAGFWTRACALLMCGMLVMFIAAIAIALSRDLPISCGCFASSTAGDEISAATLWRDSIWLVGACYVLLVDDGRIGLDGWLGKARLSARPR